MNPDEPPAQSPAHSIDRLIKAAVPSLDPELRMRLRYDLVNEIHDYEAIGARYGLGGEEGLFKFLGATPDFCAEVGKLRALLNSDMSAQERCRMKAAIASEELVARIAGIVANPSTTAGAAIDGFKQLNRMAGVDGLPAAAKEGNAQAGTQFSLTINMPGGRTEQFTTVVEAPVELPSDTEE